MKNVKTLKEIKASYKVSNEVKAKDKAFANKVKATFIIITSLCLIAYVIINVIYEVQMN